MQPRTWSGENNLAFNNFAGGLNNVSPDNLIADNELTDCMNMCFLGDSIMETRKGTVLSNYNLNLNQPITWIDDYKPLQGNWKKIVGTSNKLYVDGQEVCTTQGDIRGVNYIGKYYFVDGHDLRVYNGTKVYRVIGEPVGWLSKDVSANATTLTFHRLPEQLKQGDTCYISASVAGGTAVETTVSSVNRNNNTVTIAQGATKKMYSGQPIMFYKPSTGVYGDVVEDDQNNRTWYEPCMSELGDTNASASYFPDSPSVIAVHKDRLFVAGDSQQPHGLYMSSARQPQPLYFPSGAGLAVKPNGKPIVDLIVFDDALIIARNEDMYVLYGETEYGNNTTGQKPFEVKQMDVTTGVMSTGSGALINNFYIFLGYDGRFYRLNTPTTYVEYLMTQPLYYKCDIHNAPFMVGKTETPRVSAVAYRNEVYFSINHDLIIVYNYDNRAYTYYQGMMNNVLFSNDKALFIGRTDGKITKYADGEDVIYTDLGEPIMCTFHTKRYDCGSAINYKYFKQFMIVCKAYDNINNEIKIGVEMDFWDNPVNGKINADIAKFGQSVWGRTRFNNKDLYESPWFPLDVRGRTIKYKLSNESAEADVNGQPFRIYSINTIFFGRDVR